MADDRPKPATTPDAGEADEGSYTARPSKEPPAEGTTRDESREAKERTGGDDEPTGPGYGRS